MIQLTETKPIHAKPSLYAFYFEKLKEIALRYGYNLVLHGSMNRDLDLIAIPWQEKVGSHDEMIEEFIREIGGSLMFSNGIDRLVAKNLSEPVKEDWKKFSTTHHGRMQYVINVNRECGEKDGEWHDPQYYIDISVMPTASKYLPQGEGWISCEDRVPHVQQIVLAWKPAILFPVLCKYVSVNYGWGMESDYQFQRHTDFCAQDRIMMFSYTGITHWMPLPAPPIDQQKKEGV